MRGRIEEGRTWFDSVLPDEGARELDVAPAVHAQVPIRSNRSVAIREASGAQSCGVFTVGTNRRTVS
jgi:hypothetical protein